MNVTEQFKNLAAVPPSKEWVPPTDDEVAALIRSVPTHFAATMSYTWSRGRVAAAFGTVLNCLCPPHPGKKTRLTHMQATVGTTAHQITVLRCFNTTTVATAAVAASNTVVLAADPGVFTGKRTANRPLATGGGDYLVYALPDGTFFMDVVSSWVLSTLTVTTTLAVPTGGIPAGSKVWFMGTVGDTYSDPNTGLLQPTFTVPASATTTWDTKQGAIVESNNSNEPLIVSDNNITATGTLECVGGTYGFSQPGTAKAFEYGSLSIAFGTVINILVIPQHGKKTKITGLGVTASTTAHTVTVLRPLNWVTTTAAALASQAVVALSADPGAFSTGLQGETPPFTPHVANIPIATGHWLAFETPDGTYYFDKVSSVSGLNITMTNNLPTGGIAFGARVWFFGAATSTNPNDPAGGAHPIFTAPASTTKLLGFQQASLIESIFTYEPLLVQDNNATATGTLEYVAGEYGP
jgi:hypothetical protein